MWWKWEKLTWIELVLLLVGLAFAVAYTVTRSVAPDLSAWFILGTFPCSVGVIVIAFQRWNHGRVPRDPSE